MRIDKCKVQNERRNAAESKFCISHFNFFNDSLLKHCWDTYIPHNAKQAQPILAILLLIASIVARLSQPSNRLDLVWDKRATNTFSLVISIRQLRSSESM